MKKQILAIINDENKKNQLVSLSYKHSAEYINIPIKDINTSLGEILGLPLLKPLSHPLVSNKPMAPSLYCPPDLMIFNNFSDPDLERFLEDYKAQGIEPTNLKGSVTPHNLTWSIYEIIKEYEEEQNS